MGSSPAPSPCPSFAPVEPGQALQAWCLSAWAPPAARGWPPVGPHRFLGNPSCPFALLLAPGRVLPASPLWREGCCPRAQQSEGLSTLMMSRFNDTASGPAAYASRPALPRDGQGSLPAGGWPLPGGSRTLWIPLKDFRSLVHLFPPSQALPVASWSHARRRFIEAQPAEPALVAQALEFIGSLYAHEARTREEQVTEAAKGRDRRESAGPVVEEFFAWLDGTLTTHVLLPSNPFRQAAHYVLGRQAALRVFLADPAVPLDTNHLERQIRPIALGRRNWLFCWTEVGACYAGVV